MTPTPDPSPFPSPTAHFCWYDRERPKPFSAAFFRRAFEISQIPDRLSIIVSADNRYRLWINGIPIGRGPLKGTPSRYYAETYDLAPFLRQGRNVLAAEVRWLGDLGPISEVHTDEPGLYVQGIETEILDTPGKWKVHPDTSLSPNVEDPYKAARGWLGYLDKIDYRVQPTNWQSLDFNDYHWQTTLSVGEVPIRNPWGIDPAHCLVERDIPPLLETPLEFDRILLNRAPTEFPFTIPPGESKELWLDAGKLTTGYPNLHFTGGEGRRIDITYAEALGKWQDGRWEKSRPRSDIDSSEPHGYSDSIILDGGQTIFEPFHWRTFWFIKVKVYSGDQAVTLTRADYRFTTYPQDFSARFICAHPQVKKLWDISLRTLQLCAHETYEDCPYFEQLNYVGDTRLQALCSYYLANDTSLAKRCIQLYRHSLQSHGLTASREPCNERQEIPAFSLHWILMLSDYWNWVGPDERDFVRSNLPAVISVLSYFRDHLNPNGFVGELDNWTWTDWVAGWERGVSPADQGGNGSTYHTALFALALEAATRLINETESSDDSGQWKALREQLLISIREKTWSSEDPYFLDGPGREEDPFSQHAQAWAILSGAATSEQREALKGRLLDDTELKKMSLFQRFYLCQALNRIGDASHFFQKTLDPWYQLIHDAFTTWPENEKNTRSDCHAWSSWPIIEFFQSLLGARPAKPGWREIQIAPRYEATRSACGSFPSPVGEISISWECDENGFFRVDAKTPTGIPTYLTLPDGRTNSYPDGGGIELELRPKAQSVEA